MTAVAKEIGRTYKSVLNKILRMRKSVGQNFEVGKLSAEEDCRLRQALLKKEDYKEVEKRDEKKTYNCS